MKKLFALFIAAAFMFAVIGCGGATTSSKGSKPAEKGAGSKMKEPDKEDKAKEDKAKEDKAKEDKAKEDKAKEDKAKEDKAKEDKAKEDKAKPKKNGD